MTVLATPLPAGLLARLHADGHRQRPLVPRPALPRPRWVLGCVVQSCSRRGAPAFRQAPQAAVPPASHPSTRPFPRPECKAAVPRTLITGVADGPHRQRYEEFGVRSFVDDQRCFAWCPAPGEGREKEAALAGSVHSGQGCPAWPPAAGRSTALALIVLLPPPRSSLALSHLQTARTRC